jgi:hypothetical protein
MKIVLSVYPISKGDIEVDLPGARYVSSREVI